MVQLQIIFDGHHDEEQGPKTFPMILVDPVIHSPDDIHLFVPYAPCSDEFLFITVCTCTNLYVLVLNGLLPPAYEVARR